MHVLRKPLFSSLFISENNNKSKTTEIVTKTKTLEDELNKLNKDVADLKSCKLETETRMFNVEKLCESNSNHYKLLSNKYNNHVAKTNNSLSSIEMYLGQIAHKLSANKK